MTTVYLKLLFVGYFLTAVLNGVSLRKGEKKINVHFRFFAGFTVEKSMKTIISGYQGGKSKSVAKKNMGYVL